MLVTLYGVQMLKTQVKMLNETHKYSEKWYWREASLFNVLKVWMEVWSEEAKKCRNKTEYKNYAVFILEKIEECDKIMKEIKK
jgi:hypothetical protein